jgi:hypothetical protein
MSKKSNRRRKRDDKIAVLVVDDGDGPIAFTLPAELAPEARLPGIDPAPASPDDRPYRRLRLNGGGAPDLYDPRMHAAADELDDRALRRGRPNGKAV